MNHYYKHGSENYQHVDSFPPFGMHSPSQLSEQPFIHPTCKLHDCKIGGWTSLGAHTEMSETTFGDYSYTAGFVSAIYADIGKFSSIARDVRINPGNHPQWRVTQHHCTYRKKQYKFGTQDDAEFFEWRRSHKCIVGHDTWIGHGAIIMPNVKIGTGAIVGSGAIVTKDVGPYEIVVGVAAKTIKKRFPDDIIEKLLSTEWWDWDRATLEARFDDLNDINLFLEKYS